MTAAAQKRHKHIEQKKMTALAVIFFAAWGSVLQGGEKQRRGSVKEAGVGTQRLGLRQHPIHLLKGQALLVAVLRSAAWESFSVILIGPPSFLL